MMKRNADLVFFSLVIWIIGSGVHTYAIRMMHAWFQHAGRAPGADGESSRDDRCGSIAIPSRYKTMKNPVTATPEVIHEGMAHWADHCAACHANNGSGDTMYGKTMYPRPPDMRQKDTQEMSDGELYYTIKNGVRLSGMPAFGDPGDDDMDSWKLVALHSASAATHAC